MLQQFHSKKYFPTDAGLIVKRAAAKIKRRFRQEVLETRILFTMLMRWMLGEKLSHADRKLIKSQLLNLGKFIPLMAILLLPFGSLMLIFAVKFLPLSILPTAFTEFNDVNLDEDVVE